MGDENHEQVGGSHQDTAKEYDKVDSIVSN